MGYAEGAPRRECTLICYRGACDSGAHPLGYNRVTHGLYCLECARLIDDKRFTPPGGPLFPYLAVTVVAQTGEHGTTLEFSGRPLDAVSIDGGAWNAGLIRIRPPE